MCALLRVFTLTRIALGISECSGYSVGPRGAARTQQRWGFAVPRLVARCAWPGTEGPGCSRRSTALACPERRSRRKPWVQEGTGWWWSWREMDFLLPKLSNAGFAHPWLPCSAEPVLCSLLNMKSTWWWRGACFLYANPHVPCSPLAGGNLTRAVPNQVPVPVPVPDPVGQRWGDAEPGAVGSQPSTNLPTTTSPSTKAPCAAPGPRPRLPPSSSSWLTSPKAPSGAQNPL